MQVNEHPVEQEEVMAYLDGELPSDRTELVAAHLESCGQCQEFAAELRDVSRQLAVWQVEVAALQLPAQWKPKRAVGWKWWGGLAAACVLIGLALRPGMMEQYTRAGMAARETGLAAYYAPPAKPMIARTSQLSVVTKEFDEARGRLEDILKRHRGYLGKLEVAAPADGPRTLTATLRVPADQLDLTMAEIKKLGDVESESQTAEEVMRQYVDLDARLTNARNTEQRLTALLHDRTGKLTDVLAVEKEIDRVRGQIEQMEAEKKALVNRVEFTTLNVTMREASTAQLSPDSVWDRLRGAAADGYASLLAGLVGAMVFLLAYGPNVLLWGGLAVLALRFVLRRFRRVSTLLKFGSGSVE
jgi:anti-sigma factor RsiW